MIPISRRRLSRESAFTQEHAPRFGAVRGDLLWIENAVWATLLRGETPPELPSGESAPLPPLPPPPDPVPREKWPLACRGVAKRAIAADKGVGDTLERLAGKVGGRKFKRIFKRITGLGCGCDDRQAWLNARYPYAVFTAGVGRG